MFSSHAENDMVECPYNKSHRMLRKRLQSHLLRCRENYCDVELQKCPFNNTHLVPEPEFVHHVTNCPDRKIITQYKYNATDVNENDGPKHAPVESEENWDDTEVEDYNPMKYGQIENILRRPNCVIPAEQKAQIKRELKRYSDDEDGDTSLKQQPPTPPPPSWHNDVSPPSRKYYHLGSRSRSRSPNVYRVVKSRHSPSPSSSYQRNGRCSPDYNLDDDPYYNGGKTSEASAATSSCSYDDADALYYQQRQSRQSQYHNESYRRFMNVHHLHHDPYEYLHRSVHQYYTPPSPPQSSFSRRIHRDERDHYYPARERYYY